MICQMVNGARKFYRAGSKNSELTQKRIKGGNTYDTNYELTQH